MANPKSVITDDQILSCIKQIEQENKKVTISAITTILHVRRDRVQHILAKRKDSQLKLVEKKHEDNIYSSLDDAKEKIFNENNPIAAKTDSDRQNKIEIVRKLINELNSYYGVSILEILELNENNDGQITLTQFGTHSDMFIRINGITAENIFFIAKLMNINFKEALENCINIGIQEIKEQAKQVRRLK